MRIGVACELVEYPTLASCRASKGPVLSGFEVAAVWRGVVAGGPGPTACRRPGGSGTATPNRAVWSTGGASDGAMCCCRPLATARHGRRIRRREPRTRRPHISKVCRARSGRWVNSSASTTLSRTVQRLSPRGGVSSGTLTCGEGGREAAGSMRPASFPRRGSLAPGRARP